MAIRDAFSLKVSDDCTDKKNQKDLSGYVYTSMRGKHLSSNFPTWAVRSTLRPIFSLPDSIIFGQLQCRPVIQPQAPACSAG